MEKKLLKISVISAIVLYFGIYNLRMVFEQTNWTQVEAISSIFLTFVIVLTLNFGLIERNLFKPKFHVLEPIRIIQPSTEVLRIPIKNSGNSIAREVEASLEEIFDPGEKIPRKVLPVPLNWMHSQLLNDNKVYQRVRDIYIEQTAYLDIADLVDGKIRLSILVGREIPEWSELKRGISILKVVLYERSGRKQTIRIQIDWVESNIEAHIL